MIDDLLTNYNIKFNSEQLDNDKIANNKFYYKIYNNKINEPIQKFWFSVCSIKYLNNYNDYKTIRFLMNNKSEEISNLINFIKDLGNYLVSLFDKIFPNISIDYPWKEIEKYPLIFSFFTNQNTLLLDSNSNNINYNDLSQSDIYSVIFEISNIKILPIILDDNTNTFTIKINLSLLLLKVNEKKNLKDYVFNSLLKIENTFNNELNNSHKSNTKIQTLPFLNDISNSMLFKKNINLSNNINTQSNIRKNVSNILIINKEQLLLAKNTLKKVYNNVNLNNDNNNDNNYYNNYNNYNNNNNNNNNNDDNNNKNNDDSDDNQSNIISEYIDKKNKLRKVKTEVKSLLSHLKLNKESKKIKKNKKDNIFLENELELELELERELERELENIIK